jgi:DNA-binding GntR family transcriptional regulator
VDTGRPVERAADRAHAHIRDEILHGRLTPGTMLSENDLASALGMSRTPVRSALTLLQDEGWVTIYPQRGALVREIGEEELREATQVRHALELAGVKHAVGELRDRVAEQLAHNLDRQADVLAGGDFVDFTRLAMLFHRAFVEMAGNVTMLEIYDRLQDRQQLSIIRSSERIAGEPEEVLAEHRQLLADARAGDWPSFALHLDEHQSRSHGLETGLGTVSGAP